MKNLGVSTRNHLSAHHQHKVPDIVKKIPIEESIK